MKIGTLEIGQGQPCAVIAELSCNHNGDRDRLGRLIDAAKAAGADAVKFQCYTPDELVALRGDGPAPEPWGSQGWTMRSLYEKARTPFDWFPKIKEHCERVGIPWFSSVFGAESLALLESLDCPAYKLASLDMGKKELRKMVQATGKPVIRSSSSESPPPGTGLKCFCPPGYPQTKFHLRYVRYYDGFSYHGTGFGIPLLAAVMGASFVEVHFQLHDEPSVLESAVSLTEDDVTALVRDIRAWEACL